MPTFTRGLRDGEVTSAKIAAGAILDSDVNASAAIAQSKLDTLSITEALLTLADNTTANTSATKHGFCPKIPNNTTTFLRGDATFAAPTGGGNLILVSTQTIAGAAVTTVEFNSLDINTDGAYLLVAYLEGAATSNIALYFNDDVTDANYVRTRIYCDSSSVTPSSSNDGNIGLVTINTSATIMALIQFEVGTTDDTARALVLSERNADFIVGALRKTAAVANITDITLKSVTASSIGIGSRISLFKLTTA